MDMNSTYSGILLHKFSDHLPTFIASPLKSVKNKLPKFIKISTGDSHSYSSILNDLENINWSSNLETDLFSNPDGNYKKFVNIITDLKNHYFPTKIVRFKRHRHKNNEWITNGILASIKQKDSLYKRLLTFPKTNPSYFSIKAHFRRYENMLKSLIKQTKKDFLENQFNKFKNDMKNTWRTIKDILNKNKSVKKNQIIFCKNGELIEGDLKIANEFNKFFH